jgi:hypothetical protein
MAVAEASTLTIDTPSPSITVNHASPTQLVHPAA